MSATTPSTREFTFLGVTYGLYACGLLLIWPTFIGVVLAYVKRSDVADSFLGSHYGWLIRTFWWWAAWWAVIVAGMVSVIVPNAMTISTAVQRGDYLMIPWSLIGAAIGGAIALSFVWLWVVYRLTRGALRLSDGLAVP
jgi:uncharacterized membrane protein